MHTSVTLGAGEVFSGRRQTLWPSSQSWSYVKTSNGFGEYWLKALNAIIQAKQPFSDVRKNSQKLNRSEICPATEIQYDYEKNRSGLLKDFGLAGFW